MLLLTQVILKDWDYWMAGAKKHLAILPHFTTKTLRYRLFNIVKNFLLLLQAKWAEFIQFLPLQNPLSSAGKTVFLPAASVGWA